MYTLHADAALDSQDEIVDEHDERNQMTTRTSENRVVDEGSAFVLWFRIEGTVLATVAAPVRAPVWSSRQRRS